MVDPVNNGGGVRPLVTPKNTDPATERRERKVEDDKQASAREADRVELSDEAQQLAQVEDTARQTRAYLEKNDQPLSGGKVDALV
jgi:anti-sigma28 factor (negative regulator of flagellin synthesis)